MRTEFLLFCFVNERHRREIYYFDGRQRITGEGQVRNGDAFDVHWLVLCLMSVECDWEVDEQS